MSNDFELLGLKVSGDPSMDQLKTARVEVEELMQPADDQELMVGLVKLKSLTASRNMTDQELDMQIEAMVAKLKEYPRDAALKALERIADDVEWFPSWKQIKDWCLFYSRRRKLAQGAIEAAILSKTLKGQAA